MANTPFDYHNGLAQGCLYNPQKNGAGMIELSDDELARLAAFMSNRFGINLKAKRVLVQGRLNNYLIQSGYENYESYLNRLFRDETGAEASRLAELLTTNYSFFMREQEHFIYMREAMLPALTRGIRDYDLRVWSAGCSTGEEPYGLAMVIGDYLGADKRRWDSKILATDISGSVLNTALTGIYGADEVDSIPSLWRQTHFDKLPDGRYQAKQSLREEVIFRKFNLVQPEPFPFKKKFHIIFCRNVMIYFDQQTRNRLTARMYEALEPGGYLVIGHSEFIDRGAAEFVFVRPSIFRKKGERHDG
jgi:chemotaxis protein methyltransferase CheR